MVVPAGHSNKPAENTCKHAHTHNRQRGIAGEREMYHMAGNVYKDFFAFCGYGGNSQTLHLLKFLARAIWIYVSGFETRYNFVQIGNFELVVCFESIEA